MTYPTMQNPFEFAKNELANLVKEACEKAIAEGALPEAELPIPPCEEPNDPANGDLSSTFALTMAKKMRTAPRKIAEAIVSRMDLTGTSFKSVAVAGAGFINVTFGAGWYGSVLESIAAAGETFGALSIGQGKRVMLEFVSANPTGP
ncbi:MAG: arginine--tRNA ligase, partial [Clostridia bacterium]|nr:arginine--tRNA ligase [Clostridia bacterium]